MFHYMMMPLFRNINTEPPTLYSLMNSIVNYNNPNPVKISEQEPLRVLGTVGEKEIIKATKPLITTQCIRVPVLDGHTAAVFIKFAKTVTKEELIDRLINYKGEPPKLNLPSAPKQFIQYLTDDNRPQVTMDVDYGNGMGISIGRLREDTVYDYKFVGLSHNTIRGAAGGGVLCAELLKAKGYISKK